MNLKTTTKANILDLIHTVRDRHHVALPASDKELAKMTKIQLVNLLNDLWEQVDSAGKIQPIQGMDVDRLPVLGEKHTAESTSEEMADNFLPDAAAPKTDAAAPKTDAAAPKTDAAAPKKRGRKAKAEYHVSDRVLAAVYLVTKEMEVKLTKDGVIALERPAYTANGRESKAVRRVWEVYAVENGYDLYVRDDLADLATEAIADAERSTLNEVKHQYFPKYSMKNRWTMTEDCVCRVLATF